MLSPTALAGRLGRSSLVLVLLGCLALFGAACGGDGGGGGGDADSCTTGADCAPGFACVDAVCTPRIACDTAADCPTGVCEGGACVEPASCAGDDHCLPGNYCAGGVCQDDPCADVTCERGVCDRGTLECVSADACTPETEERACLAGDRCFEGQCIEDEALCEALDCQRGVCSVEAGACVNADSCTTDTDCIAGSYCGDAGTCQDNQCDEQGITCERGVCDPRTFECVDAEVCHTSADCLDGSLCVDQGDSATCLTPAEACGDGQTTCPGTQICAYDETTRTAECAEDATAGCANALDCTGDRICDGRSCIDAPSTCQPDDLEPNDTAAEATDLGDETVAPAGVASARLCAGDVDTYTFDLRDSALTRGTRIVELRLAPRDVGMGEVTLSLLDAEGNQVEAVTSGAEQVLRLEAEFGPLELGVYTIEVRSPDMSTYGASYDIFAGAIAEPIQNACEQADALSIGQAINADTSTALTTAMGSSCTSATNAAAENVYTFTIDSPSRITATVSLADAEFDASISLLSACGRPDTELACADASVDGEDETLTALLDAGTYALLVQGASAGEAGAYALSLQAAPAGCLPSDSYCSDATTAQVCVDGTLTTRTCSNGCETRTGTCVRSDGDTCQDPIAISGDTQQLISWANYRSDITPPSGTNCSPSDEAAGPEAVFAVEIPAGQAMEATMNLSTGENGALYLMDTCEPTPTSCLAGADATNATSERLSYLNETAAAVTLTLVADSQTPGASGNASLDVRFLPVICSPGERQCSGDDLEACGDLGATWSYVETCSFGCTDGACDVPPNDVCAGAIQVPADGQRHPYTGNITDYNDDYDTASGTGEECTNGFKSDGQDAVYVVSAQAGDLITASMTSDGDASIWITSDCAAAADSCLGGDDSGEPEAVQVVAPTAGDYYVIVDHYSSTSSGVFNVDITVESQVCTPSDASCADPTTLEFCNAHGTALVQYSCQTSCVAGGGTANCDPPEGDVCPDAIDATAGLHDYRVDMGTRTSGVDLPASGCLGSETTGHDIILSVGLLAGEVLAVDVDPDSADDPVIYVADSCTGATTDPAACLGHVDDGFTGDGEALRWVAPADGTYYVVVDAKSASTTTGEWRIDLTHQFPACTAGATRCSGPDTLEVCSSYEIWEPEDCYFGCANGACNPPTNDQCSGAIVVPRDGTIYTATLPIGEYADDYDASTSCTGYGTPGVDAIYRVDALAGDVIDASMTSDDDAAIWIVDDCADAANSCLVGQDGGEPEAVQHVAATDGAYYVIVDHYSSGTSGEFSLEIQARPPDCTPGSPDYCVDAQTRAWCDSNGLTRTETCDFGCSAGACNPPTNDQCSGALVVPRDGQRYSYSGDITDYADDYDAGNASGTACTNGYSSSGQDAVYVVNALAGDTITVSMTSTYDSSVWITTDCATAADSCVVGDDSGDPEQLTYTVPADGAYYVIADQYTSASGGTFDIDITAGP